MILSMTKARRSLLSALLPALALAVSAPLAAQEAAPPAAESASSMASSEVVSPEAQAVLDRMTRYLRGLQTFQIDTQISRDEVVAMGYKLQHNEHSTLIVQRPDKLRADIAGDLRNRTIVYSDSRLTMYSPDDAAYVRISAPPTLAGLIGTLLDAGVDMPGIDVLYQSAAGTLTQDVRGGVLVGETTIDGVLTDHLAFRSPSVDWQLWVDKGAQPLPRKLLITTRFEVGDPQYQALLHWNLKPRITGSTFAFVAPKEAKEIPLAHLASNDSSIP